MKPRKKLREEAEARRAACSKRSIRAQLTLIEQRPGESKREKERLEQLLKVKPVAVSPATVVIGPAMSGKTSIKLPPLKRR